MVLVVDSAPPVCFGGLLIAAGFGLRRPSLSASVSRNAPAGDQGAALLLAAFAAVLRAMPLLRGRIE